MHYYRIVFQSSISYELIFFIFYSILNKFRGKALGSWHSNKTHQGNGFIQRGCLLGDLAPATLNTTFHSYCPTRSKVSHLVTSERFPCFNSWGVKKASCYVSSFLSFSFCIIYPMLSMNFKQRVLCFDAVERDGWWWGGGGSWSVFASSEHNTHVPFGKKCLIWGCFLMHFLILWDLCVRPGSLCLPVSVIKL